jgi:CRP-like cAMP-binding protein
MAQPDDVLYAEHEPAEKMFVVLAGRLAVKSEAGGRSTLAYVWPGQTVGDAQLLRAGGRRRATLTAVAPTAVAAIPAASYRLMLEGGGSTPWMVDPEMQWLVRAVLAKKPEERCLDELRDVAVSGDTWGNTAVFSCGGWWAVWC